MFFGITLGLFYVWSAANNVTLVGKQGQVGICSLLVSDEGDQSWKPILHSEGMLSLKKKGGRQ